MKLHISNTILFYFTSSSLGIPLNIIQRKSSLLKFQQKTKTNILNEIIFFIISFVNYYNIKNKK